MIPRCILGLALILPNLVCAQQLTVISGNHSTFARIVVLAQDLPSWQIGRNQDGYRLRLEDPDAEYSIERVFERIPRDRIANVISSGEGRLDLEIACECYVDAFEIPAGLVVDIRDGSAPEDSSFEAFVAEIEPEPNPVSAFDARVSDEAFGVNRLNDRRIAPRTEFAWQSELALPPPNDVAEASTLPPPHTRNRNETGASSITDEVSERIFAEIGRAASKGLINVPGPTPSEPSIERDLDSNTETSMSEPDTKSILGVEHSLDSHLRFETVFDRSSSTSVEGGSIATDLNCFDTDTFNVANWSPEKEEFSGASVMRMGLLDEFDLPNPKEIKRLAKNYIYLSFGAEASALLSTYPVNDFDAAVLLALSSVVDGAPITSPIVTEDHVGCPNRTAFWAMLMLPQTERYKTVSRNAILLTFSELPLHLRRHLGPTIVDRFLALSDIGAANQVSQSIERAANGQGAQLDFINGEIAFEAGAVELGLDRMESVLRADGLLAPVAAARLLNETLDQGEKVDPPIAAAAAALASELAGSGLSSELLLANLRARAHSGSFLHALQSAGHAIESREISHEEASALLDEIYMLAASTASDLEFLNLATHYNTFSMNLGYAGQGHLSFARRLLELGLNTESRFYLERSERTKSIEHRKLLAESYFIEDSIDRTLAFLENDLDSDAQMLSAKAYERRGDVDRALSIYDELGEAQAYADTLLRSERWIEYAEAHKSSLWQNATELLRDQALERELDPVGSLSQSIQAIEKSKISREHIRSLFSGLPGD